MPTVTQQQSLDVRSLQTFFGPSFPSQGTEGGRFSDETPPPPNPHPPLPGEGTFGAVNARVLVVAQEEALLAAALVAPQGVEAGVLAAAVVLQALVHVWRGESLALALVTVSMPHPARQLRDSY